MRPQVLFAAAVLGGTLHTSVIHAQTGFPVGNGGAATPDVQSLPASSGGLGSDGSRPDVGSKGATIIDDDPLSQVSVPSSEQERARETVEELFAPSVRQLPVDGQLEPGPPTAAGWNGLYLSPDVERSLRQFDRGDGRAALDAAVGRWADEMRQQFPDVAKLSYEDGVLAYRALGQRVEVRNSLNEIFGFKSVLADAPAEMEAPPVDTRVLLDWQEKAPDRFDKIAGDLGEAYSDAVAYALREGLGVDAVRFVGPEQYTDDQLTQIKRSHLVALGYSRQEIDDVLYMVRTFPIEIDDRMIIWIDPHLGNGDDEDFRIKSVGPNAGFVPARPTILPNAGTQLSLFDPDIAASAPAPDTPARVARTLASSTTCGDAPLVPCFDAIVSLHTEGRVQCSGVLIAPTWVLTAAHCVCDAQRPLSASVGQETPDEYGVAPVETATVPVKRQRFFFPETRDGEKRSEFCPRYHEWRAMARPARDAESAYLRWVEATETTYRLRDLALLELTVPLYLSGSFRTAVLATPEILATLQAPFVSGYGRNNWQAGGGLKSYIGRNMLSRSCQRATQTYETGCTRDIELLLVDDEEIPQTDTCFGDSGGGVVVRLTSGALAVVAIVSRGITDRCGAGGINALVTDAEVQDWIRALAPQSQTASEEPEPRFVVQLN